MNTPAHERLGTDEHRGAIMQPTYLPWIGYFALMREVDTFVLLDSVQFQKHSWQQRNRIKTAVGVQWLTVSVLTKGRFDQTIAEAEINPSEDFRRKHIKAIEIAYRKAPYFAAYAPAIFEIVERPFTHLAELTVALITHFAGLLNLPCKIVRSSSLGVDGKKSDLLASICTTLGISHYISPPGSAVYLREDEALKAAGIRLSYSDWRPNAYPQLHGEFLPLVSFIDCLFNVGPDAAQVMEKGRNLLDAEAYHRFLDASAS